MSDKRVLFLLAATACGRAPQPDVRAAPPASEVADTMVEGLVRVVGPLENAQVVLRAGTAEVALIGDLVPELRRLAGAGVRATGKRERNPAAAPEWAVNVADYQIVAVDGERPYVGIVMQRGAQFWLVGQDTLELLGAPPDLAARVGAKVFVNGTARGGQLLLRSYGVIREP